MCAIAGIQGSGSGSLELLKKMTDRMAHRGPDGYGYWSGHSDNVFFGHRRLSIVDLADGAQPMTSSCGRYTVTFNGEIYNHAELKKQLVAAGRKFHTDHSDTEVLVNGFAEWGTGVLDRLNGMWAFAIYDEQTGDIFLARDRFGKKPLYYSQNAESFVFASELTALTLHPGVSTQVSELGLCKFFGYGYIPAPHTALRDVKKLPAGHWMRFNCRTRDVTVKRYWRYQINPCAELARTTDSDLVEEFTDKLRTAVERRMIADVPLGVFLSGGLDSSTVAALSSKNGRQIDTFSIGFEEASFDESRYAKLVSDHLDTRHFCKKLRADTVAGISASVLQELDEPMGDSSLVATSLLSEFAASKVKVALGGDGADELLCGYDPFKAIRYAKAYQSVCPKKVHEGILYLMSKLPVSHRNMSLDFKLKRALRGVSYQPGLWAPVWMSSMSESDFRAFTGTDFSCEEVFSEAIEAWEYCDGHSMEDRLSQFFVDLYLQDDILPKVDRASMLHGLEVRAPFLDIDVVDFISKLPTSQKFHKATGKVILRNAARNLLPEEILTRPKKGFGIPLGKWFKDGVLHPGGSSWGDKETSTQLHHKHINNQSDERAFLWNRLVVNEWQGQLDSLGEEKDHEVVTG